MIDVHHFRDFIVQPTLIAMGLHSDAAENLLVGTAVQESRLTYLKQIGGGPALGLFQMEPATHDDIWANYLAYREDLADTVRELAWGEPTADCMVWDLRYATAMCRVHYKRVPAALPPANAIASLAEYWKAHYNTPLGAGTEQEFIDNYQRHVMG